MNYHTKQWNVIMIINSANFLQNTIGMPTQHAPAFFSAAATERSVIISRATGPACRTLLQEGYCTKGFRIHGKSCDWGPMAGFVLRDPRLNKKGMNGVQYNRNQHNSALFTDNEGQGWLGSTTPLVISEQRRQWLVNNNYININYAHGRWNGTAQHPTGITFQYSLFQQPGNRWGVYIDNFGRNPFQQERRATEVVRYIPAYGQRFESMLAMTNPPEHRLNHNNHYLNAVTGDYDLFAVWPRTAHYNANPGGDDYRPLGTTLGRPGPQAQNIIALERQFDVGNRGTKLGNITNRIYMVGQLINSIVGRHVIWHSDESARPFVDDVDLPLIAFVPNIMGTHNPPLQGVMPPFYVGLNTIADFQNFIIYCVTVNFHVTLSNGWTLAPTAAKPNRLGPAYNHLVPANTVRTQQFRYFND